jgi:dipeptidase E
MYLSSFRVGDHPDRLPDDLAACELVWVRGGNSFLLRHALAVSGGDQYGVPARFDGLALLDRPFVPHLDSPDHPETELVAKVAAPYRAEGVAFHALRDGEVLVLDVDVVELL